MVIKLKILINDENQIPKPLKIKHCPCPKYVMIYKPNLYNLETRKKQLIKLLRIETDPS